MSLRPRLLKHRVLLVLSILIGVHLAASTIIGLVFVLPSFVTLEREQALAGLARCTGALAEQAHNLSLICGDWAAWDDTYRFVLDGNEEYVRSNVVPETLERKTGVNALFVIDPQGAVKTGLVWDSDQGGELSLSEFPSAHWPVDSPLLQHQSVDDETHSLLLTDAGPMVVAAHPILTSQGAGPIRGTVVMGRILSGRLLGEIQAQIHQTFSLRDLHRPGLSSDEQRIVEELQTAATGVLRASGTRGLKAYALVPDVTGAPALLLVAEMPTEVLARGALALQYALGSSAIAAGILLAAVYALMQRCVLARVTALQRDVMAINATGDLTLRVSAGGRDEFASLGVQLNQMLSRAQCSEQALRHSGEMLQAVFESAPVGLLLFDSDFVLRRANDSAASLFSRSRQTMPGLSLGLLTQCVSAQESRCGSTAGCQLCVLRGLLQTARIRGCASAENVPQHNLKADGVVSPVWHSLKVHRITIAGTAHFVLAIEDVTAKREAERHLHQAKERAEEANRLKSRFLSNISHEIRTPLNGIMGFAEALTRTATVPVAQEHARVILREANVLLLLVNDLLDLAKAESGKLAVEQIDVNLVQLVEEISQTATLTAREKGLTFVATVAPDVPRVIRSDPLRLRQILLNLVSNAIKFTANGTVRLTVARDSDVPPVVRMSVCDTGIGIAAEKQQAIFDVFTQADAGTTRRYGGTGLGLAIVRQLVQLLGGTLGLESAPGHGSTFWVTIPAKPGVLAEASAPPVEPVPGRARRVGHVLVADDYGTNLDVARLFLQEVGHRVTTATSGLEALEACGTTVFDLILMDLHMPGLDGRATAARIRLLDSPNARVPILALTATADAEIRLACAQSGMNDVLTKPIGRDSLLVTVNRWLEPSRPSLPGAPPAEPRGTDSLEPPIDLVRAAIEFSGRPVVDRLLADFLRRADEQIAAMHAAIDHAERVALQEGAHALKGAAATLEATPLARCAAQLEAASSTAQLADLQDMVWRLSSELQRLRDFAAVERSGGSEIHRA